MMILQSTVRFLELWPAIRFQQLDVEWTSRLRHGLRFGRLAIQQ